MECKGVRAGGKKAVLVSERDRRAGISGGVDFVRSVPFLLGALWVVGYFGGVDTDQ